MSVNEYDLKIDTCHLLCPGPIIETKKHLSLLLPGQTILVVTMEASFKVDFAVLAKIHGHKLLDSWQEKNKFFYVIQK
jgi:TusA-related sulfurtransferase